MVNSLNYSYNTGKLTDLQKQSIITLLPKQDKDLSKLENWRPISLLNTDYKIASKTIANRFKKVLINIIDSNQTGFVKGRYIGENIRLLLDLIEESEDDNSPGVLVFTDFEKAFDSIDHDLLFKILEFFKFWSVCGKWGKSFLQRSQQLYL